VATPFSVDRERDIRRVVQAAREAPEVRESLVTALQCLIDLGVYRVSDETLAWDILRATGW
jgi:anti-sigma28 factor (negative regulator of flagellin synthesis)